MTAGRSVRHAGAGLPGLTAASADREQGKEPLSTLGSAYSRRQLFANAAIAASRVVSPWVARMTAEYSPEPSRLAHLKTGGAEALR